MFKKIFNANRPGHKPRALTLDRVIDAWNLDKDLAATLTFMSFIGKKESEQEHLEKVTAYLTLLIQSQEKEIILSPSSVASDWNLGSDVSRALNHLFNAALEGNKTHLRTIKESLQNRLDSIILKAGE